MKLLLRYLLRNSKAISRREIPWGSLLQLGFFILFTAYCKSVKRVKKLDDAIGSQGQDPNGNSKGPISSPFDTPEEEKEPDVLNCDAPVQAVPIEKLKELPEELKVKLKFYGDAASTMLVVVFPNLQYESGGIVDISLLGEEGKPIAQRGIIESVDVLPDTSMRPIVFQNLVMNHKHLTVLIKRICFSCELGETEVFKYVMNDDIRYESMFMGKPAYGLLPHKVSHQFEGFLPVVSVIPNTKDSRFSYADDRVYATSDSKFLVQGLRGFVVTDLAGNVLSFPEEDSSSLDILKYRIVVTYRLVDDSYYVREFYQFF